MFSFFNYNTTLTQVFTYIQIIIDMSADDNADVLFIYWLIANREEDFHRMSINLGYSYWMCTSISVNHECFFFFWIKFLVCCNEFIYYDDLEMYSCDISFFHNENIVRIFSFLFLFLMGSSPYQIWFIWFQLLGFS